jgi:hypothetical protein
MAHMMMLQLPYFITTKAPLYILEMITVTQDPQIIVKLFGWIILVTMLLEIIGTHISFLLLFSTPNSYHHVVHPSYLALSVATVESIMKNISIYLKKLML